MSSPTHPTPDKPLVLLAEDDPVVGTMIERSLQPDFRTHRCKDGMEAYIYLRSSAERPRVLVTDVMMPRLDGFALAQRLQADPTLRALPIIFLTALGNPKQVVTGLQVGARAYLTKPFRREELLAKVHKILGG